jgi:hypothetical protein
MRVARMAKDEQRLRSGIREKSPCAYCPDDEKYTACHDTCKKFEKWRAKLEAVNEARKAYEKLSRR